MLHWKSHQEQTKAEHTHTHKQAHFLQTCWPTLYFSFILHCYPLRVITTTHPGWVCGFGKSSCFTLWSVQGRWPGSSLWTLLSEEWLLSDGVKITRQLVNVRKPRIHTKRLGQKCRERKQCERENYHSERENRRNSRGREREREREREKKKKQERLWLVDCCVTFPLSPSPFCCLILENQPFRWHKLQQLWTCPIRIWRQLRRTAQRSFKPSAHNNRR